MKNLNPRIEEISSKKMIGKKQIMSLANFQAGELWKNFIPKKKEILNPISKELYSISIYPTNYFHDFQDENEFEKWAAVEVACFENIPSHLETLVIQAGLYAVFEYKGMSSDPSIFHYIFWTWLPNSNWELDQRPHFEILGDNYINNDPNSEEEIWIPIKQM
ncbi:AraC family transcriptional regulator [Algoriphagus kandeliae]|uniref:AraC family transcriptional regulator n=1 Tax=Algoriphagus kandeliae TaxID=2562278 RepID=A0A4Y9QNH5_9BACT|nr:GyrI-like domain-containing protein [Algoriphagus kandeliae]TFV94149.1 AraC family transcriptional regulator [Algoriphagus kandeliae]